MTGEPSPAESADEALREADRQLEDARSQVEPQAGRESEDELFGRVGTDERTRREREG